MARFITLANGTRIVPGAVQTIEARALVSPWTDASGRLWPAMVFVETRHQVVRCPCASLGEAQRLRDEIAEAVERHAAQRAAQH
ncbi:MAG TPA: hypothetical protein PK264_24535, partial [Hyphomicrobiaceae bacterium]|nr:hypothetical protein [Hyphomicrobiaceae bacterium]